MLNEDAELKEHFEFKKQSDEAFAQNWYAQLDWLFKRSAHYEAAHFQYPVYRVLKKKKYQSQSQSRANYQCPNKILILI